MCTYKIRVRRFTVFGASKLDRGISLLFLDASLKFFQQVSGMVGRTSRLDLRQVAILILQDEMKRGAESTVRRIDDVSRVTKKNLKVATMYKGRCYPTYGVRGVTDGA